MLTATSWACARGAKIGLRGDSGAGKSTIVRMLTGEVVPAMGEVTIAGASVDDVPVMAIASRAICYNCVEDLRTGRFRVCTADFVEPGATRDANQERYFVEQIADWSPDDPEQPQWFDTLEAAIAAHDADFEN